MTNSVKLAGATMAEFDRFEIGAALLNATLLSLGPADSVAVVRPLLVSKAHRPLYHSTRGSRVIKKKTKKCPTRFRTIKEQRETV